MKNIPEYTEEEIKRIEEEFDREGGWIKASEEFGEERTVNSLFIKKEEKEG